MAHSKIQILNVLLQVSIASLPYRKLPVCQILKTLLGTCLISVTCITEMYICFKNNYRDISYSSIYFTESCWRNSEHTVVGTDIYSEKIKLASKRFVSIGWTRLKLVLYQNTFEMENPLGIWLSTSEYYICWLECTGGKRYTNGWTTMKLLYCIASAYTV